MRLDMKYIKKILPHRYRFLLIDRVTELKPGKRVVAVKDVKANEWFFKGHFPGHPIMSGALIIEIMAQTSIFLYYSKYKDSLKKKPSYYLYSVKEATFRYPVVSGDQLKIEAQTKKLLPTAGVVDAKVFVKDKEVAVAELIFGIKR